MSGGPRRYTLPPEDAHLPVYESRPPKSSFGSKLRARIVYNRFSKWYLTMRNPKLTGHTIFELKLSKHHYHAVFAGTLIALCSFYL